MLIGGLQPVSLLDYPDKVAAIVFTKGCNFLCRYCHNPLLVRPEKAGAKNTTSQPAIQLADLWAFLDQRKGRLEAVVITGGEPTLHQDLLEMLKGIKKRGFLVKLDTNGTNSQVVIEAAQAGLIDYVAMDVKAPWERYHRVMPVAADILTGLTEEAKKTAKWLIGQNIVDYQFRTTLVPEILGESDIRLMSEQLRGAKQWFLQKGYLTREILDPNLAAGRSYTDAEMEHLVSVAQEVIKQTEDR
ncbi:MAG TPA: anaerobic ribonucleoside-triphosphate reductase activating protein [bacterium]|nr:anaerobic ribonucleoside-triphosphate reductase activating protein [bacterium]